MRLEVGDRELVEFLFAEDGAYAAEVFAEGAEDTPPILLVIDLQALEGSQAVVRLDQSFGDRGAAGLHAFIGRQRVEEGAGDGSLKFGEGG